MIQKDVSVLPAHARRFGKHLLISFSSSSRRVRVSPTASNNWGVSSNGNPTCDTCVPANEVTP